MHNGMKADLQNPALLRRLVFASRLCRAVKWCNYEPRGCNKVTYSMVT